MKLSNPTSMSRRLVAGVAVLGLAAGAVAITAPAASAGGAPLTSAQVHKILRPSARVHTFPCTSLRSKVATSLASAATNLVYHGGQVMSTANHAVPIFWEPTKLQSGANATLDPQYNTLVQRYFNDVGGNGLYQINAQYSEIVSGSQHFILNSANLLQAVLDTSAYPAAGSACTGAGAGTNCLDDAQLQTEITKVINSHAFPVDKQTEYYVYLSGGENQCYDSTDCFRTTNTDGANFVYCAYHSYYTIGSARVIYSSMPYGALAYLNECTDRSQFPNNAVADTVLSTTSHEQMESVTDPYLDAWYDTSGAENGDKCAYNLGTMSLDGGLANEQWNGHFYALQQEWDNATSSCLQGLPVTRTVKVTWTATEAARIAQMAPTLNTTPAGVQKVSVYTLSFLVGLISPTPQPTTLPPPGTASVTYTDTWQPNEFSVLDRVKNKYVLSDVDATRLSESVVDFLLGLSGH